MTAAYNKFLIDGKWVGPQDRSTLNVINPATEEAFATISLGTAEDVDAAVKAAQTAFGSWSSSSVEERKAVIGKIIEGDYTFPKNVYYISGLRSKEVYSCMKQSIGLINTSISEGMSLSILEAMKLRCPVYAFKNKGNESIITSGFNGFIFDNIRSFRFLIKQPTKKIINNAYDYVYTKHSTRLEKHEYLKLLD